MEDGSDKCKKLLNPVNTILAINLGIWSTWWTSSKLLSFSSSVPNCCVNKPKGDENQNEKQNEKGEKLKKRWTTQCFRTTTKIHDHTELSMANGVFKAFPTPFTVVNKKIQKEDWSKVESWFQRNFVLSPRNIEHRRYHVIFSSGFAHQGPMHMAFNAAGLLGFGPLILEDARRRHSDLLALALAKETTDAYGESVKEDESSKGERMAQLEFCGFYAGATLCSGLGSFLGQRLFSSISFPFMDKKPFSFLHFPKLEKTKRDGKEFWKTIRETTMVKRFFSAKDVVVRSPLFKQAICLRKNQKTKYGKLGAGSLGASGAIMAMAAADAARHPDQTLCLIFAPSLGSISARNALAALFVVDIMGLMVFKNRSPLDHSGHIAGVLFGLGYAFVCPLSASSTP